MALRGSHSSLVAGNGRLSSRSIVQACSLRSIRVRKSSLVCQAATTDVQAAPAGRRALLAGVAGVLLLSLPGGPSRAEDAAQIEVVADEAGFGQHPVRQGDLVLMHYTGTLPDGQVFDSTQADTLRYRDGGFGVFRPVVVRLSSYPQPGICLGLQQAVEGMRIGGRRTVKVPAALGFGDQTVLAPYAIVPGGSTVTYQIELLRVSSVGPDLLVKGISRCGAGGAGAAADGCRDIQPAEFF